MTKTYLQILPNEIETAIHRKAIQLELNEWVVR